MGQKRPHVLVAAIVFVTSLVTASCNGASPLADSGFGPSMMSARSSPGPTMTGMRGMMGAGMTAGSEFDYLTHMIPHHEEAIAAARVLERGSARQEMRTFAASIIETQTAEVAQMKAWLAEWHPGRATDVRYEPMMRDLNGQSGNALDQAFLEDMITHHMMAVMMSQQLVRGGLAEHAAVVPFAENIRDTQHAEIQMMARWLRSL